MTAIETLDLQRAAKEHLWMHFTRMGGYEMADVPIIVRGEGCYLEDSNGKRYLDALAGLFSVNLGYSFGEEIGQAALEQMRELPFYTNWSYAHPRAIELASEIASLAPGDLNLTFKRYLESPVRLSVESDYVTRIDGESLDAELMREYLAAWGDREAYAVSHVGWGMNARARWDAMAMYDRRDVNGTEQRAFAGNFLYSTGANEVAGRHTLGHFDLPFRHCTIELDGKAVVRDGKLVDQMVWNDMAEVLGAKLRPLSA